MVWEDDADHGEEHGRRLCGARMRKQADFTDSLPFQDILNRVAEVPFVFDQFFVTVFGEPSTAAGLFGDGV